MSAPPDAKDLAAIERAVNDSSTRITALWLTFLSLTTYLAISLGSVTHRILLLEARLKMPVLNVDLPLIGFFVVAPLIYVLFHLHIFVQLTGITTKIVSYDSILREQIRNARSRRLFRQRLDNFIFIQLLAGSRERRQGRMSWLLLTIAWITMVAAPLCLLLYTQLTFLPYQHEPTTWFHRAVIAFDAILIAVFWPLVNNKPFLRPHKRRLDGTILLGIVATLFATLIAIFPGERLYDYIHTPVTRLLFEGKVNQVTGQTSSLFCEPLDRARSESCQPTRH